MTIAAMAGSATWLESNTWDRPEWTIDELIAHKEGRSISVVLPALDEERTVGSVVASIMPLVGGLVDEVVVVDSGSSDATMARAAAAGARVESRESALPGVTPLPGKGEVLWRSLATTVGDIVVYIDSDLVDPDPMYVPRLVGPLLLTPELQLVKGYYRRPLVGSGGVDPTGGGRVTELVVRPLVSALRPELSALIQPLAGEYAGTRELLTSIPFAPGYGVEIGIVLDTLSRYGMDAIGQVDLGTRTHRNRPLRDLGPMSRQIVATLMSRLGIEDSGSPLIQFLMEDDGHSVRRAYPVLDDRPPMRTVPGRTMVGVGAV
ncbi:glucosyl-3-phosphoglycerate synthase [Gordonia hankookensis]|uniref:Glucosyl-3-phosphoglycerate synthase n=1 Tax=Gordonia hankookensis TaxID=589403 RepID=A0ABR7WFZ4_9ACTN|nr:glucosyl-3-phosphoglycerate synthase [Gordonia hankookensis]MBD1321693.1 glucosyl-3-phosphoglycerate synthase [Gordonia hankookensis]